MTDIAVLTRAEEIALADCEQRIERGLSTFFETGQSLAAIRENRLYKGTHATFESYLAERWNITGGRARQLMIAAGTVTTVTVEGLPAPTTERQARELSRVPEADRADVWRETVERTDGKPTAAAIRDVHTERTASTPGPSDAAVTPPVDPGATPAPAEAPSSVAPREPDPQPVARPVSPAPTGYYRDPQPDPEAEERRQRRVATHQLCEVVVAVAQMRGFDTGWKYEPGMALPGRAVTADVLNDARQADLPDHVRTVARDMQLDHLITAWKTARTPKPTAGVVLFHPSAILPLGNGEVAWMDMATADDLRAWGLLSTKNLARVARAEATRQDYVATRLTVMRDNPDWRLGRVERDVYGWVEEDLPEDADELDDEELA